MTAYLQLGKDVRRGWVVALVLGAAFGVHADAQSAAVQASVPKAHATQNPVRGIADAPMPTPSGTQLDRVVAIVNGDLILDSDVDEERRLRSFEPYRNPGAAFDRAEAIERLINRDLILQQAKLQPEDQVSDADVKQQLDALRKAIPACAKYNCATQAGWEKFLADNGFSEAAFNKRWKQRMEVLQFIEDRFRMGIKITPADVRHYYTETLVPEYRKQDVVPPKLDEIAGRIQEVLLQDQISGLLSDWLKSLREQGSIAVLHAGEEAP
jgi:peptidyl-prolyl cis-trans isomerase SurA